MAGDPEGPPENIQNSLPNGEIDGERKPILRSRDSRINSFVRFMNKTIRHVDIVWINFEGAHVKYKTLRPDEWLDINTYAGHPWIFRDSKSGDKLVVHLNDVYMPIGWTPEDGRPTRRLVQISIPVYSLKERCLQVVRRLLPNTKQTISLDIPNTLKDEILKRNYMED